MARPPAFQFYVNDWLSSTKIALMTAEQERGYLRLLLHAWNDPDCCLPDDDEILSRLSLMGEGWFTNASRLVRDCFEPNPNKPGTIVNKRLSEVRARQDEWRQKSAEGGRKSGQSRRARSTEATTCDNDYAAKGGSTTLGSKCPTKREPKGNSSAFSLQPSITPYSPSPTKRKPGRQYTDAFGLFWAAYPRREAKGAAFDAFEAALSRIGDRDGKPAWQFIVERARAYALATAGTDRIHPHPTTWLNQDRFDDDPRAWTEPRPAPSSTASSDQVNFFPAKPQAKVKP